jgi:L-aspartate oxidase
MMSHHPLLIVGGGLAGLFTALKLAPKPVTVLAAAPIGQGASSAWAQGGIAAALSEGDSPEKHTDDTVKAGAGIVERDVVLGMAREARGCVDDLLAYGVPFDKDLEGHLVQSREAAHSERRIVRVKGDTAGKAIMEALVAHVRRTPSITVLEGKVADELIMRDGQAVGVVAHAAGDPRETHVFTANAVMLATGGAGSLYALTTNPPEAKGTGIALAARAGAMIADPEFVQFHPTAIAVGRDPAPLATEALRGDGAILVNGKGERFMCAIHPDAELAPRDVVARGVFAEIAAGRGAFLDARTAIGAAFPERFPTVYAACRSAGIDPVADLIPVAPAEHYHMGGVMTDARGKTSLPGLWAAGEVASTGVHGANRLASNSLLEAVVFGARIAADLGALDTTGGPPFVGAYVPCVADDADHNGSAVALLRETMQRDVGVVRDGDGLARAVAIIASLRDGAGNAAFLNMATTALIIATAALKRTESRGGHYRSDYPQPDPALQQRTMMTLADAEAIAARGLVPAHRRAVRR